MEYQVIKKQVEYYEDKIIINFDTYFNELVLMDFYEGGYSERIEDEFFYDEYFEKYENNVINLLLEIENEQGEQWRDLKLRLIGVKRAIDNHIAKIKKNDINEYRHQRNIQFVLNQKFNANEFINLLYTQLKAYKLIEVDFKSFNEHFTDNWNDKIKWLGTQLQITNLINLLIEKDYLDKETTNNKYNLLSNHFINKQGKLFIPKQLGSVYSEKKEMIAEDDVIYTIIKEMSTHF